MQRGIKSKDSRRDPSEQKCTRKRTDELKEVGMRRKKKKEKETKPAIVYLYLIGRHHVRAEFEYVFFCFCGHDQKELILHSHDSGFSTSFMLHHWFSKTPQNALPIRLSLCNDLILTDCTYSTVLTFSEDFKPMHEVAVG
jgi:hypothetical protein